MKLRVNQSVICIVLVLRKLLYFLSFLLVDQWGKSATSIKIFFQYTASVLLGGKKKSAGVDEK